jgi:hypothetical protein
MAVTKDQTSSGHERYTCVCGKSLVRQPYMQGLMWISKWTRFVNQHSKCERSGQ